MEQCGWDWVWSQKPKKKQTKKHDTPHANSQNAFSVKKKQGPHLYGASLGCGEDDPVWNGKLAADAVWLWEERPPLVA